MIDGKTIADLRIRLLTMRVAESQRQTARSTVPSDIFTEALFPTTKNNVFYQLFSPRIGELLAMADGFNKLRQVRAVLCELNHTSEDPAFVALRTQVERICAQFDDLMAASEEMAARADQEQTDRSP